MCTTRLRIALLEKCLSKNVGRRDAVDISNCEQHHPYQEFGLQHFIWTGIKMSPRRASRYNVDKVRDVQVVRRALSSQSGVISAKCVEKVVGCGRDVLRDALVVI